MQLQALLRLLPVSTLAMTRHRLQRQFIFPNPQSRILKSEWYRDGIMHFAVHKDR